jgi:hypothetical protein
LRSVPAGNARTNRAASLVSSLTAVCKNLGIYPATHPRVVTSATEFVQLLAEPSTNGAPVTLTTRGDELLLDGELAKADERSVTFLCRRIRECGLRGVEFDPVCTTGDVASFANALNRFRPRVGTTFASEWADPNPRVRPLPLVFKGSHDPNATGDAIPHGDGRGGSGDSSNRGDAAPPAPATAAGTRSPVDRVLSRMAGTHLVQNCLRSIEQHTITDGSEETRDLDLLAAVGELLPADLTNDPAQIEEAVTRVMTSIEASLSELVRKNAKVKGAELLRMALGVARRYFHTSAPEETDRSLLPTGRPEDEKIVADLGLLRQEISLLPPAGCLALPAAEELPGGEGNRSLEILGILLHTLVTTANQSLGTTIQTRILTQLPQDEDGLPALLDAYLGKDSTVSTAGRLRLLEILVASGKEDMLREHGFVDAAFVARTFPEGLALAARVLGGTAAGIDTLREALHTLAPTIEMGGAAAAARAGVLRDPAVLDAILTIGGPEAAPLMAAATAVMPQAERQSLLECLRSHALPPAEAAVLDAFVTADRLPRDYLPALAAAAALGEFEGALRSASSALLRRRVLQGHGRLSHEEMVQAVADLAHAPGPETEVILRKLSHSRWLNLGSKARALRRVARTALAAIAEGGVP